MIAGVATIPFGLTPTIAQSQEKKLNRHQAVILQFQGHYQYTNSVSGGSLTYDGVLLLNSSSSQGAPEFTNTVWVWTNGDQREATEPIQSAQAIADLLNDGFEIKLVHNITVQTVLGDVTEVVLTK